jgi:lipopolysaccharide biosynthesis regulator YciM
MELHNPTLVALLGGTVLATVLALLAALSRKGRTEDTARAYLAGFTYVLSDDPDAAIAELSRAAQLNTETLETYFALGALFRRKGELDRAIRLHRNILLRPGLTSEVRRRAHLELALDYKRSALNDKAMESFEKLLAEDPTNREALLQYRRILEASHEWQRAVEIQLKLVGSDRKELSILAHLFAETVRSLLESDPAQSEAVAARAVELEPDSADALLALGESMIALGRRHEAEAPLLRSMKLEPELAPRITRLCVSPSSDPRALEEFLLAQIAHRPRDAAAFELAIALLQRETGRTDLAVERLRRLVERNPRFWEARRELGNLLLAQGRAEELRQDYRDILSTLGEPALAFLCRSCRQRLPEFVFRCPSCEEWDKVRREDDERPPPLI